MSAGGLARLGVRCPKPSWGMASLGINCATGTEARGPYTRYRNYLPIALQEDEEMLLLFRAFVEVIKCR